jgi:acyl-CoA thioesterase
MNIDKEGFYNFLKLKLIDINKGFAKVEIEIREDLKRFGGLLHGGAVFSVLDYAGTIATRTLDNVVDQYTIELKIVFMKKIKGSKFIGIARVISEGKTHVFIDLEGYDDKNDLVVKGLGIWYVVRRDSN